MKKICFSCDDWFFDTFLKYHGKNKSCYIRELIASQDKVLTGFDLSEKIAFQKLFVEHEALIKENHSLKLEIGKLKSVNSKKGLMTEQEMKIAFHKAWTLQGGMH